MTITQSIPHKTSAKPAYAPETQECQEQLGAAGVKTLLQELARSQARSGLGAPGAYTLGPACLSLLLMKIFFVISSLNKGKGLSFLLITISTFS